MAASGIVSTNPIVPLNGKNYPTWKLQCQMALMKDNLWRIVTGAELEPEAGITIEPSLKPGEIKRWRW